MTGPDVTGPGDDGTVSAELIAEARHSDARSSVEPLPERLRQKISLAVGSSISAGTRAAYETDLRDFEHWCAQYALCPLPAAPATVAGYFVEMCWPDDDRAPLSLSTIKRRRAAIGKFHTLAGLANPCLDPKVKTVMAGITRTVLQAAPGRKKGVSTADLRASVADLGDRLIDHRDRLILLWGYAGALRRSELVALDVGDVEERPDGLLLNLRSSKRDQEGRGARIEVVYGQTVGTCPVRAWRTWLDVSRITAHPVTEADPRAGLSGGTVERYPVLRPVTRHGRLLPARLSAQAVGIVVKRHMRRIGKTEANFAGHSLRRGHATEASRNQASDRTIRATTRHRSAAALDPYIEEGQLFSDPSSRYLGL